MRALRAAGAAGVQSLKFVFLLPGPARAPVGGYTVIYQYANRLVARGHEVTVVHARLPPAGNVSFYRRMRYWAGRGGDRWGHHHVRWFPLDRRVRLGLLPSRDGACLPQADAVFATAWQTAPVVAAAPLDRGEKFYFIQHHEVWSGSQREVDATWRLPLHKIVIARWLQAEAERLEVGPVDYLPIAMDHRIYRLIRPMTGRAPRVAMMYSPLEFKGCRYGLQALEMTRAQRPELEAVLFGTSPRPRDLPAWIVYHHDPPRKTLVEEIYNGAAIFLAPSLAEGWPAPPAEAALCGCAIVASANGGVQEYVEHERTGLLSPLRDATALSRDLCRLLQDEPLRLRLADGARRRLLPLDWERNTERLQELVAARIRGHQPDAAFGEAR